MKVESIIPMSIIETGHPEVVSANVLTYPELDDPEFDTIDPKDYQWEERDFVAPLFSKIPSEEVFLVKTEITEAGFTMRVYEDLKLSEKAKKAFADWDIHSKKKWQELSDSGFFKKSTYEGTPFKIVENINKQLELYDNDQCPTCKIDLDKKEDEIN